MAAKILFITLLTGLLMVDSVVQGKRISEIKCEEYINATMAVASGVALVLNPVPTQFVSFNCSKAVDLIVGGEEAKKGEFRHQALLGWETDVPDKYRFDCGGTVVSEWYVLTAAHCASRGNDAHPAPVIVRFAELNVKEIGDAFNEPIDTIIKHPRHRFKYAYHDIALVRLVNQLRFSSLVQPACLWTDEDTTPTTVIATGFGNMESYDDHGSDVLRKVQLNVTDLNDCNREFVGTKSFPTGMMDGQLCIGSIRGGMDTCQGDSGGPIQVLDNLKGCIYHVVGVTSTGTSCGSQAPAVYTKVASYIDWIEEVVWGSG